MISIAIQAARLAPFAKQVAPKVLPVAKEIGISIGVSAAVNEVIRYAIHRGTKNRASDQLERFETTNRPLWKKLTGTHADETYPQGLRRRGRVFYEIACYGLGNELFWLNLLTVKVVKGIAWTAGSLINCVAVPVSAFGTGGYYLVNRTMHPSKLRELTTNIAISIGMVTLFPFRSIRRVDRALQDRAFALMAPRSALTMLTERISLVTVDPEQVTEPTAVVPTTQVEVTVDEHIKEDKVKVDKEDKTADVFYLTVLLTNDVSAVRNDPKAYGVELRGKVADQSEESRRAFRSGLHRQLRKNGLSSRDVALVVQGYDETDRVSDTTPAS